MLELLKFVLDKFDFISVSDFARHRKDRRAAGRLHLILVQAYEILALYRILLDELRAAMLTHQRTANRHEFFINPARLVTLLERQSSNLDVMERLMLDLLAELRILDNRFAETYEALFPGKFGILFEAQGLLSGGRLPIGEGEPTIFPAGADGVFRTLWFTWDAPDEDRAQTNKYLHGFDGTEKRVVDVNIHDGDVFFVELQRYFSEQDPYERLEELKAITEGYKDALASRFSLIDVLSEIGNVSTHDRWVGGDV